MTTSVQNSSFYADFQGLAELKREAKTQSPDALRAAAQQFEGLFTQMMLKSMREASFGDSLAGSETMDFYQGMFDQQLSTELSKGSGMGLADLLIEQLTRQGLAGRTPASQTQSSTGAVTSTSASDTENASSNTSDAQKTAFIEQMWPHAQRASQELGVDAGTLVAHAALETGWGQHTPHTADGGSSNNLFGIKSTQSWNGDSTLAQTLEYENGTAVQQQASFKAYSSPADSFNDYVNLLGRSSRYSAARGAGDDVGRFATALQQGGYATDPNYANKLQAVADTVARLAPV